MLDISDCPATWRMSALHKPHALHFFISTISLFKKGNVMLSHAE